MLIWHRRIGLAAERLEHHRVRGSAPFRGKAKGTPRAGGSLTSQIMCIFPAIKISSRNFAASSPRRARWLVVRRDMGYCFRAAKLIKHYQ